MQCATIYNFVLGIVTDLLLNVFIYETYILKSFNFLFYFFRFNAHVYGIKLTLIITYYMNILAITIMIGFDFFFLIITIKL